MKKSPIKEFIITSVAAAVAGYVVKKGFDYFKESSRFKKEELRQLPAPASKALETSSAKIHQVVEDGTPAEKGLMATLAYTLAAFMVTKFLRKVI